MSYRENIKAILELPDDPTMKLMVEGLRADKDIKFLLSFAPKEKPEDVPKGLTPEFYHTLNYNSEVELAGRIQKIRDQFNL